MTISKKGTQGNTRSTKEVQKGSGAGGAQEAGTRPRPRTKETGASFKELSYIHPFNTPLRLVVNVTHLKSL